MRAHKRSWKVFAPALASAAVLLPAAIGYSHPDALGTRFVSPTTGTDTGDCDDNHHPCRTLNYALEPACRRRIGAAVRDQRPELIVEIMFHRCAQLVATDTAGRHDLGGMFVVDKGNQKMFESRVLVAAPAGFGQGVVQGLFEFASETGHLGLTPARIPGIGPGSFIECHTQETRNQGPWDRLSPIIG